MTKKNNANSARRKLIPAVGMLVASAMMLSSSTYAWFSMSKDVSVTGMKIQATAEEGLVITDKSDKTGWATSKNINMTAGVALAPTSTNGAADNTLAWVKSKSRLLDDADKDQTDAQVQAGAAGYTALSLSYAPPTTGTGESSSPNGVNFGTGEGVGTDSTDHNAYVLLKNFWIKSTGSTPWVQSLVIDEVTATATGGQSGNLNKTLRVLVVVDNATTQVSHIYAPITGYDNACKYMGTTTLTLVSSTTDTTCTGINPIPITDDDAINVKMYMYFEGEDANCKSTNLSGITLDTLTVSAKFKTTAGPADPSPQP